MPDPTLVAATTFAGVMSAGAVLVAGGGLRSNAAQRRARPASTTPTHHAKVVRARSWLEDELDRAGWREGPERVAGFAVALSACLGSLGATSASALPLGAAGFMCLLGVLTGLLLPWLALRSAVAQRRRRLEGELVPLLELFSLELGGGGSAVSALGSVTMQVQGELAADLRRLLIASQVAGSASFESRLVEYADLARIPSIGSLATILAASREYGTGVVQGVRALATDLRRAQRRELIAHSRRALNHVLLPAAVGVLLPFLAVLMYPAVSALERNLR
jgi:Flp pilus assembly protein TadB